MNDAWLKAELEGALNALKRIEADIPKLRRTFERIATIRGVEVEDKPADPLKKFNRAFSAAVAEQLAADIDAAIMHPGDLPTLKRDSDTGKYGVQHPGESVQTWHEDKGPEWPEEEE